MAADKAIKEIVIIGGSYVGLQAAHYVLKHIIPALPEKQYQVSLVDRSTHWFARVGAPRGAVSEKGLGLDKLFYPIEDGFKSYSKDIFKFIQATATGLDTASRTINLTLADGTETVKSYYALIIATGASPLTPLLGVSSTHADSIAAINSFRERLSSNPPKSIVIAGGGPAGVETAGELGEFLNGAAGWFASRPAEIKTKITLVTAGDRILNVLRPSLGKKAEALLGKVGVDVLYNSKVVSTVPENAGTLNSVLTPTKVTLSNGKVLDADIYIPAVGTPPNTKWLPPSLLAADHRIITNQETSRVDAAGSLVYAIGDASNTGRGGLIEVMFGFAPAMNNVKNDLVYYAADEKTAKKVKDVIFVAKPDESQLVPIGHIGGVGAFGGWSFPSFMVWLAKGRDYLSGKSISTLDGSQWAKEKVVV